MSTEIPQRPQRPQRPDATRPEGSGPDGSGAVGGLTAGQATRLRWSMLYGNFALFTAYAGLIAVLLPAQVEHIDAADKVSNLALVTMASSIATLFVQPIIGALSDRTSTRFGRRAPWMVVGAVAGAIALVAIAHATTILWLTVLWVAVQVLLNILQAPLTAILPDRVPAARFGTFSAFIGLGSQFGATFGVILATGFTSRLGLGYGILAGFVLVATLAFIAMNPDRTGTPPKEPFSWKKFAGGFWVPPKEHPDFAWAFGARLVFVLGYWGVFSFARYALQDYVHLSAGKVNTAQAVMSVINLATMLLVAIPVSKWSDRIGRRKVFVNGAAVLLAGSLVIPLASPTLTAMYAYSVISGMGYGIYMSLDMALMTEVLPAGGDAGKDLGILNIATNVPQAIGPVLGSVMISVFAHGSDKAPGYRALYLFAMVIVLLSMVFIRPIKSVE